MKGTKKVVAATVFLVLAAYSLFFTPVADATYYDCSRAGDYNNDSKRNYSGDYRDRYYDDYYDSSRYHDNDSNYRWSSDKDWIAGNDWLNQNNWTNQDEWFNSRYSYFNQKGCYNDYSCSYYAPDSKSSVWRSNYEDGNRRVFWNKSDKPFMNLSNYRNRYSSAYGSGNIVSPSYAKAIAVVDRSNPNNAIIILNTGNYIDSGLSKLTRASIAVDSSLFNELADMIDNYGSDSNVNLDCRNNRLWYGNDYGGRSAGVYFRGAI